MNDIVNIFKTTDLATNMKKVDSFIVIMEKDFRVHNHSNTQFAWKHFVLSHKGGLRNLRQVTAEVHRKQQALHEAKFRHKRQLLKRNKLRYDLSNGDLNTFKKQRLQLKLEEIEAQIEMSLAPIEGAVKDILTLKSVYDELMEKYKGYTEADLEQEEAAYWIRRIFSQSLRCMRAGGTINTGNQEVLEQLGFNVSYVVRLLIGYLEIEETSQDTSTAMLDEFLEECVENYREQVLQHVGYGGFNKLPYEEVLYK